MKRQYIQPVIQVITCETEPLLGTVSLNSSDKVSTTGGSDFEELSNKKRAGNPIWD